MNGRNDDKHDAFAHSGDAAWVVSRRDFLRVSGSTAFGLSLWPRFARAGDDPDAAGIRFGLVTDPHYADLEHRGHRYYRESLAKMTECVELMNEQKVAFLVELGDFKDQASPPVEEGTLSYLQTIEKEFQKVEADAYHVLGNHDVDSISKDQFRALVTDADMPPESTYYSFDKGGFHFIVLDANYRTDGLDYDSGNFDWTDANVPPDELRWLERDLASTSKPSIVFAHQQLDGEGSHYVRNAAAVRLVLQKHKRVLAVFQGHNHAGHYSHIEGIHYYTLKAMVEGSGEANNSYTIVDVHGDHGITVTGYRRALSKELEKA